MVRNTTTQPYWQEARVSQPQRRDAGEAWKTKRPNWHKQTISSAALERSAAESWRGTPEWSASWDSALGVRGSFPRLLARETAGMDLEVLLLLVRRGTSHDA